MPQAIITNQFTLWTLGTLIIRSEGATVTTTGITWSVKDKSPLVTKWMQGTTGHRSPQGDQTRLGPILEIVLCRVQLHLKGRYETSLDTAYQRLIARLSLYLLVTILSMTEPDMQRTIMILTSNHTAVKPIVTGCLTLEDNTIGRNWMTTMTVTIDRLLGIAALFTGHVRHFVLPRRTETPMLCLYLTRIYHRHLLLSHLHRPRPGKTRPLNRNFVLTKQCLLHFAGLGHHTANARLLPALAYRS